MLSDNNMSADGRLTNLEKRQLRTIFESYLHNHKISVQKRVRIFDLANKIGLPYRLRNCGLTAADIVRYLSVDARRLRLSQLIRPLEFASQESVPETEWQAKIDDRLEDRLSSFITDNLSLATLLAERESIDMHDYTDLNGHDYNQALGDKLAEHHVLMMLPAYERPRYVAYLHEHPHNINHEAQSGRPVRDIRGAGWLVFK